MATWIDWRCLCGATLTATGPKHSTERMAAVMQDWHKGEGHGPTQATAKVIKALGKDKVRRANDAVLDYAAEEAELRHVLEAIAAGSAPLMLGQESRADGG